MPPASGTSPRVVGYQTLTAQNPNVSKLVHGDKRSRLEASDRQLHSEWVLTLMPSAAYAAFHAIECSSGIRATARNSASCNELTCTAFGLHHLPGTEARVAAYVSASLSAFCKDSIAA